MCTNLAGMYQSDDVGKRIEGRRLNMFKMRVFFFLYCNEAQELLIKDNLKKKSDRTAAGVFWMVFEVRLFSHWAMLDELKKKKKVIFHLLCEGLLCARHHAPALLCFSQVSHSSSFSSPDPNVVAIASPRTEARN